MTKKIRSTLTAIALLGFASPGWGGALKVQPGMWMTTVTSHRGAVPEPPRMRNHCVTQKEIDEFANRLSQPSQHSPEENCRRTSFHESATAVDWKYECTGKFTMNSEGSIKFDNPSHYTGNVKMTGNVMGQAIDNSAMMEGRRIGECTGKEGDAH